MEPIGTAQAGGDSKGPLLERMVNRVLRCSHRHLGIPITLKGESFAMCLDCGQRVPYDLKGLRSTPAGLGKVSTPASPPPQGLRTWTTNLLWIALYALGLSGGLYYSSSHRQTAPSVRPAATQASTASVPPPETPVAESAEPPVVWSVLPVPPSAAVPAAATGQPAPVTKTHPEVSLPPAAPDRMPLRSASPPPAPAASNPVPHLSPGKAIVVARNSTDGLEIVEHPDRLSELIQTGALFTVPGGARIEVLQTEGQIVRVLIVDGPMAGQEGWVASSRAVQAQAKKVTP